MLAFIQFPIADLRQFSGGGHRLSVPEWPPKTGVGLPQAFVRAFGPATRRRRGADYAWLDEQSFCGAARALRFPSLPVLDGRNGFGVRCAFRRLFFDGRSVARVEVGISYGGPDERSRYDYWDGDVAAGSDPEPGLAIDPIAVLDEVLGLSAFVPYARGRAKGGGARPGSAKALILQAAPLARLYAQATTKDPGPEDQMVAYDLVAPGSPLVIVECPSHMVNYLPPRFTRVDPALIGGVDLSFGLLHRFGGDLGVWVAGYRNARFAGLRSVRLCLARLHAEQEILHTVLAKLDSGALPYEAGSDHGDRLEAYLNRATRAVKRTHWAGVQQSAIRDVFTATAATAARQKLGLLEQRLAGARKQVVKKAREFEKSIRPTTNFYVEEVVMEKREINIGPGATINAPVVMADSIQDSFNTVAKSGLDAEIKGLMNELLEQAAAAGAMLPPEAAAALGRDVQFLSTEVACPSPRRSWYENAIDSIKKTANTIGEVGEPVLKTAAKLLPLLLKLFP